VNIKKLQKLCLDAKPVIKDLVDEATLVFNACSENSEPFTIFFQHFVEKAFDFVCSLEKENLVGLEDGVKCYDIKEEEHHNCVVQQFSDPFEVFNQGICE
jgi:hypothetical protein